MTDSPRPVVYIHRLTAFAPDDYLGQETRDLLASFAEVRDDSAAGEMTPDELAERLRGASAILSLNGCTAKELDADVLGRAGGVQVVAISHWWGQHNDMAPVWREAGVTVLDASDGCNQAVAEWTVGAAICGLRGFDRYNRQMHSGVEWPSWRVARQLDGSVVGLVALGRVGRWVLRYLAPFDVRVIVYDPYLSEQEAAELGVERVDLPTLLRTADVVSLHAPVTPQTTGMIGAGELAQIRDGVLLVNSARAALFDNDALRRELASGRLSAYLDVYQPEPPPAHDVLRRLDNVVMTPHVAGCTPAMFRRCGRFAVEALRDWLAASPPSGGAPEIR